MPTQQLTQAIILAAGKSTRTYPLTLTKPKPLLAIAGTTLIEHTLTQLEDLITNVVIVLGYEAEMIKQHLKNKFKKLNIRYVYQEEPKGTAHALLQAETYAKQQFLVLPGDDLFFKEDLAKLAASKSKYAMLAKKVEHPEHFGIVIAKQKSLQQIVEKPKQFVGNLASTSCFMLQKEIFSLLKKTKKSARNEIELTDAINALCKQEDVQVYEAASWMPITYPWHLLDANKAVLDRLVKAPQIKEKQVFVEANVTIHGFVHLGKNTIIKAGTYIEGPVIIGDNCIVGPHAYLRPYTVLGSKVKVGNAVEIKNSIIGNNTHVAHLSYIGDSILGENVNIGGGTITANLRHDEEAITTPIKGVMVDTHRKKLGAIIGDHVHTGIHTSIYPGRKLWPLTTTMPGEVVSKDKVK